MKRLVKIAALIGMVLLATWAVEGATIRVELRLDTPEGDLLGSWQMDSMAKGSEGTLTVPTGGLQVAAGDILALVMHVEEGKVAWAGLGPLYYVNGDPWQRNGGPWEAIVDDVDLTIAHCIRPTDTEEVCSLGDVGFPGLYARPNYFPRVGAGLALAQTFEVTEDGMLDTVSVVVREVPAGGAGWLVMAGLGVLGWRRWQ